MSCISCLRTFYRLDPRDRNRFNCEGWRTFWLLQRQVCLTCGYFEPLKDGRLRAALCHEFGDLIFIFSWFNSCTAWKPKKENMLALEKERSRL